MSDYIEARLSQGTRLRLRELADLAGVSKDKVMDDARRGEVEIVRVKCGQRWRAEVEPEQARRYLSRLLAA